MMSSDLPDGQSPEVQFQDEEIAESQKKTGEKQVWVYGDDKMYLPNQDILQDEKRHY